MKPHKISTHLAFSDNCYFHSFFIGCLIELKFCEVSRNSISNWTWKFQLSILKDKKVLFLKKNFLGPLSISKQKNLCLLTQFSRRFWVEYVTNWWRIVCSQKVVTWAEGGVSEKKKQDLNYINPKARFVKTDLKSVKSVQIKTQKHRNRPKKSHEIAPKIAPKIIPKIKVQKAIRECPCF